jgi:nicotinate-nucleotide pyrophosphorylase (carboxylating)
VICGGGTNHRLDLTSGILIKDNHISATGSITLAVESVKAKNYNLPIEVEVDNFEQIEEALRAEIDGILLDNFTPEKTKEAVYFIRNFPTEKKIFIESSGGINLKNIEPYLSTGIDAISVGALTHSAPAANIHIEFE